MRRITKHTINRVLLREFISLGGTNYPPLSAKLPEMVGADLEKCRKNPRYFFNKYLRVEGEPVVTIQEWVKIVEEEVKKIK